MRGVRWKLLCFLVGLGWVMPVPAHAQVDITVTRTTVQRISIAVVGFPPFRLRSGGEDLAAQTQKVLVEDLNFSTIFDVLPRSFLPFEPEGVRLGEEEKVLQPLNQLRVQALVIGEFMEQGGALVLEGRIYDVTQGAFLGGKRYFGDVRVLRNMAHRLADEVVLRLTGERGVASTRIAYVAIEKGAREIYLMDYDGHNPVLVTGNRTINLSPRFSPDGKSLAYTSYRDGNPDLYLLHLEGGRREKVSALPGLNVSPAWSPDGRWLLLSLSRNGGINLYLMRPNGTGLRPLTAGLGISVSPSFSPNGRQVAFTSDRGGSPQIYIIDVEGTNLRRLTFEGAYNASPRWSPRGEKIAFMSNRGGGAFQIYLMNPDGSGVQQLTTVGSNEDPAWSPDGRHLVFTSNRGGKKDIYVMHADGSEQRRLTQNPFSNFGPDWSP